MLTFPIHECFQVVLYGRRHAHVPMAFVCVITGRGGGRLTALLRGQRAREGRFHVPGRRPTLTPIQVTPAKSARVL